MHAVATLAAIEAVLVGVTYAAARGRWDRTCLYLLCVTAPLEVYRTTIGSVNLSLFRISAALATVCLLVVVLRERGRIGPIRRRPSRVELSYVLLAGTVAASFVVHGEALFLGKRLIIVLAAGLVVMVVVAELARRTSAHLLAAAMVAGAALPSLASFWQVLGPRLGSRSGLPFLSDLPVDEERARTLTASFDAIDAGAIRLRGTFIDPNHFGIYLVFVLLLALALATQSAVAGRRTSAVSFGGFACAAAAGLVATYSRSAWAAGAVAAALALVLMAATLRARTTRRQRRVALVSCLALAALLAVPLAPTVGARLDPSLNARSNVLHRYNGEAGLRELRSHPVLGIGVGGLGVRLNQGARGSSADSTYITVAAELGLVGLTALLLAGGFVIEALVGAYRRVRGETGALLPAALIGAYCGFLGANLIYDQLWWRDFHFVLLGLVLAVTAVQVPPAGAPARS